MTIIYKDLKQKLEDTQKAVLKEALFRSNLNVSRASIGLGVSRGTVTKYIQQFWGKDYKAVLLANAGGNNDPVHQS